MSNELPKGGGGGAAAAHPPSSTGSSAPPSTADKIKDFASTHRVKKLLETYTMTAERSMMGPTASEDAFHQQKYLGGGHASNYSASTYKLPPDVELSKTSPNSEANNHGSSSDTKVDVAASRRLQMQMTTGLKGGGPMSPPPPSGTVKSSAGNGLVTLSRYANFLVFY